MFVIIGGIFYFLTELLSKNKESELEKLTVEKARAAVSVNIGAINKSLESSDDITMLSYIESIAKFENISSCFILDRNNRVIIHNNTSEWNAERKGSVYDRAVKYDGELVQYTQSENLLLFSAPLAKNYTLCCIFSIQKAKDDAKYWKIKYYTVAAAVLAAVTAVFYFLAKLFVILPFNRIKKALEGNSVDAIKKGAYNEITDFFATEREKHENRIKALQADIESLSKIVEYFAADGKYQAFMALNASNNIIFAYDKTGLFLKKGFAAGSHIVESSLNSGIIELVNRASENPGREVEAASENYKITAVSIHFQGVIIKITHK
jgi:hypothetical protein